MSRFRPFIATLLAFIALTAQGADTTLQAGDAFPVTSLENQHGEPITIDDQTQRVLFTADMAGGKVVRALLDERENAAELLTSANAIYLSDVSGMPSLIRKMMALPAMRKRPYPIMLDIEGVVSAGLPRQEGAVTVIELEKLTVTSLDFTTSPAELAKAIGLEETMEKAAPVK